MSIFPTKILLATDGSEEAELAARTAIDLADATNSELHMIYVGLLPNCSLHVLLRVRRLEKMMSLRG